MVYAAKKSSKEAIADFTAAIVLDPGFSKTYDTPGNVYKEMRLYDKALEQHDKAIELSPGNENIYNNRGVIYGIKGGYEKAMADFNRAIVLSTGTYKDAYYNRAYTELNAGFYDGALKDLSEYIKLDPWSIAAYTTRGSVYKKLGNPALAKQDEEKAKT